MLVCKVFPCLSYNFILNAPALGLVFLLFLLLSSCFVSFVWRTYWRTYQTNKQKLFLKNIFNFSSPVFVSRIPVTSFFQFQLIISRLLLCTTLIVVLYSLLGCSITSISIPPFVSSFTFFPLLLTTCLKNVLEDSLWKEICWSRRRSVNFSASVFPLLGCF